MTNPMNLGQHKHREITIDGRKICQDCQQVLWNPVTSQEDFEARLADVPAWTGPEETITSVAIFDAATGGRELLDGQDLRGCPMDYQLMQLHSLGLLDKPHYIRIIEDSMEHPGPPMPPHCLYGETSRWWND